MPFLNYKTSNGTVGKFDLSITGIPVGTILPYPSNNTIPSGFLVCDGSPVSRTMYPDLFNVIGTVYGEGDGSTTFNLPNLINKFIEGSVTAGLNIEAGLPNITGDVTDVRIKTTASASGAVYTSNSNTVQYIGASSGTEKTIMIDASRSSAIYGNSTTVQPPALTMRYIIKY